VATISRRRRTGFTSKGHLERRFIDMPSCRVFARGKCLVVLACLAVGCEGDLGAPGRGDNVRPTTGTGAASAGGGATGGISASGGTLGSGGSVPLGGSGGSHSHMGGETAGGGAPLATGGSTSSGGAPLATGGSTASGGTEGDPVLVSNCSSFTDRTADPAARQVTWDFTIGTAEERCLRVRQGQSVTFVGGFVTHPLGESGGTQPNPIQGPSSGMATTYTVTFPDPGTFGYECGIHATMRGAVQVVPSSP